jgi:hypothetical protein
VRGSNSIVVVLTADPPIQMMKMMRMMMPSQCSAGSPGMYFLSCFSAYVDLLDVYGIHNYAAGIVAGTMAAPTTSSST